MFKNIDTAFAFQEKALALRGYRQQLLASNVANADTPNYKAVDIDFGKALEQARNSVGGGVALTVTSPGHIKNAGSGAMDGVKPMYRAATQPSIDGNTVDMNVEQAQFSENALRYLTTLQFINSKFRDVSYVLRGGN